MTLRRYWWTAPIAVLVGSLAIWAGLSLVPRERTTGAGGATSSAFSCSPMPCAAPRGFEVDIAGLRIEADQVRMQVSFKNQTQPQPGEAVSYRHTSPADFLLTTTAGERLRPVFNADCPQWPEVQVPRGGSAGPEPLCFAAPSTGLKGARLVWSPDLGFFFDDVVIRLD